MTREALLARTFVELADTLVEDFDVVDVLTVLTDRCVEVLEVTAAGLMLAGPGGADLRVVASSSEAMRLLELFELQAEEGPCLDCYRTGEPVLNQDLATVDGRWPRFAPRALDAGFHSVHAVPMRLRGQTIGALNLFRAEEGGLDEGDVIAAQALADVATIAVLQHRASLEARVLNDQLSEALNTRIVIEQAKGVLAERAGLDMEQSFSRLRGHARGHNLRLADVAQAVIDGTLSTSSLDQPRSGGA
jgi:GAF domain-containing protein